MDRLEIARHLREIGRLLEAQGGSPFKARAYERGARALEALGADLEPLIAQDRLTQVPAIGPALAATIRELHQTGRSEPLERLRAALPPGVLELGEVRRSSWWPPASKPLIRPAGRLRGRRADLRPRGDAAIKARRRASP